MSNYNNIYLYCITKNKVILHLLSVIDIHLKETELQNFVQYLIKYNGKLYFCFCKSWFPSFASIFKIRTKQCKLFRLGQQSFQNKAHQKSVGEYWKTCESICFKIESFNYSFSLNTEKLLQVIWKNEIPTSTKLMWKRKLKTLEKKKFQ